MSRPTYIFAGGGTGGHLYPGLAVAEALVARRPDALVVFACSDRPIDRRILEPSGHPFVPQPIRPLPRSPRAVPGFLRAWGASRRLAREMLGDLRPRAVLGLGGFAAGAMVARAARSGVRSAVLNPDAVPGRANRFLARRAEAVFAQFAGSGERFPSAVRAKVREIGCPVRPGFATADRDEAVARFGLSPDRRTLLVCGGSSGAKLINEAITALAGDLAARAGAWQVLHVAGAELYEPTRAAWGAGDAPVVVLPYCDRMDLAYAAADLLVGRCGASTAAELAATDTPAVVLPYPFHADRQQALNAEPLAAAGAVRVVEDRKDPAVNADALRRELLPLLDDADALAAMRRAAEALPGSDAAAIVAAWLE